ncbi:MAG: hypothetical protein AAF645_23785 [Myxococcota bacterium]
MWWRVLALGAALVCSEGVRAQDVGNGAPEAASEDAERAEARRLFEEGVQAFRASELTHARRLFEHSLTLYGSPATAWNLARTFRATGEPVPALRIVEAMLSGAYGSMGDAQVAAAERMRLALEAVIGAVEVRSEERAAVRLVLDGEPQPSLAPGEVLRLPVRAGTHELEAQNEDGRWSERVRVDAGERVDVTVSFAEADAPVRRRRRALWITLGVVAAAGIAVGLGVALRPRAEVDPVWGTITAQHALHR